MKQKQIQRPKCIVCSSSRKERSHGQLLGGRSSDCAWHDMYIKALDLEFSLFFRLFLCFALLRVYCGDGMEMTKCSNKTIYSKSGCKDRRWVNFGVFTGHAWEMKNVYAWKKNTIDFMYIYNMQNLNHLKQMAWISFNHVKVRYIPSTYFTPIACDRCLSRISDTEIHRFCFVALVPKPKTQPSASISQILNLTPYKNRRPQLLSLYIRPVLYQFVVLS